MTKEEKIKLVLDLQERGTPRKDIVTALGYKLIKGLTSYMSKAGYKVENDIYVLKDCNTESHTPANTESITDSITTEFINQFVAERETFMDMLEWFKKYRITTTSDILIELPISDNVMVSCRSNKAIWEQFGEFTKEHSSFSKGDLLAQALKEYMKKYKKGE